MGHQQSGHPMDHLDMMWKQHLGRHPMQKCPRIELKEKSTSKRIHHRIRTFAESCYRIEHRIATILFKRVDQQQDRHRIRAITIRFNQFQTV